MTPHLFLFFFIFVILLLSLDLPLSRCEYVVDYSRYSNCSQLSFNCGDIQNIRYPFWGDERPDYCGLPGFKLHCDADHRLTTTIEINSATYKVSSMDYKNQNLKVDLADLLDSICQKKQKSINATSLVFPGFGPTSEHYMALFYGCSPSLGVMDGATKVSVSCPGIGDPAEVYYVLDDSFPDEKLTGKCQEGSSVIVPIPSNAKAEIEKNSSRFGEVISQDVDLRWSSSIDTWGCSGCLPSQGQCGWNLESKTSTCFCEFGIYELRGCAAAPAPPTPIIPPHAAPDSHLDPFPTASPGGNHWKVPVIVTSAAFFLGASLLILFLIYRGHKKRKFAAIRSKDISVSSTPFSRNFSSDPSLTTTDLEKASTYFGVPIFSYDELEEATSNFDSTKELGDGGFGTVYHGKLRDGRVVAVKRLYENNYKRVEQFMNEVEILTRLRHQNLVTLYGCTSRRSRELILVYEYIPNGTVADHLHGDRAKAGGLPWSIRMSIAIETASALSYLHASDIIHRDVKTNNILLDNNFGVKVADFGLSRLFPTDVTHVSTAPQGTPGYVDPEYHQCYQLTDKSDVYSFGVVLIELISSKPAVDITRHRHEINLANMAINKIQNRTLHELIDPCLNFESDHRVRRMATAVAELAFRCLQFEREMRPTMDEVLEVLNGIQSEEDGMVAKTEEADIPSDDVGLLKKGLSPPSPDSVVNYVWESQKTTPNTSS